MKRLDKLLTDLNMGSRSQVKEMIKKGKVTVNGEIVKSPEQKISETDEVVFAGKNVSSNTFFYYMLNKPDGVVSATEDDKEKTVLDLFEKPIPKGLFPVGRLDKNTEGLLVITNDGELGHLFTSPKHHIEKTYFVKTKHPLNENNLNALSTGVDIGEKELTKPAQIKAVGEKEYHLTITEGKFHQVKRMMEAVGTKVLYLKRISMGNIILDENLKPGEYRPFNERELDYVKKYKSRDI